MKIKEGVPGVGVIMNMEGVGKESNQSVAAVEVSIVLRIGDVKR